MFNLYAYTLVLLVFTHLYESLAFTNVHVLSKHSVSKHAVVRRFSHSTLISPVIERDLDVSTERVLLKNVELSGLNGLALIDKEFPSKAEVTRAIPSDCFDISTLKSISCTATSLSLTAVCGILGAIYIPMTIRALPLWILYASITGTVAMGNWVIAHECGHGAFSTNRPLQDTVGFVLHSALLVPYFSWKRSHAVHHANTNHIDDGETHVPEKVTSSQFGSLSIRNKVEQLLGKRLGRGLVGAVQLASHLLIGWPAYLMFGATGGPSRGFTNHFVPSSDRLFPGSWKRKVWLSSLGVFTTLMGLALWSLHAGFWRVLALYGGPYLVVNAWLVVYTWLQHTAPDVPHWESENFSMIKGAFHSIDRPYGPVIDFLHHRIGSTHVAHHLDAMIPHYNAKKATDALRITFPKHYLYDPTPVPLALWRVAKLCTAVQKQGQKWVFVQRPVTI